jgi:hypothetical protein
MVRYAGKSLDPNEASEVVFNDPALSARLTTALRRTLGDDSPFFAPDRERTIRAGVAALTYSVLDLAAAPAAKAAQ